MSYDISGQYYITVDEDHQEIDEWSMHVGFTVKDHLMELAQYACTLSKAWWKGRQNQNTPAFALQEWEVHEMAKQIDKWFEALPSEQRLEREYLRTPGALDIDCRDSRREDDPTLLEVMRNAYGPVSFFG